MGSWISICCAKLVRRVAALTARRRGAGWCGRAERVPRMLNHGADAVEPANRSSAASRRAAASSWRPARASKSAAIVRDNVIADEFLPSGVETIRIARSLSSTASSVSPSRSSTMASVAAAMARIVIDSVTSLSNNDSRNRSIALSSPQRYRFAPRARQASARHSPLGQVAVRLAWRSGPDHWRARPRASRGVHRSGGRAPRRRSPVCARSRRARIGTAESSGALARRGRTRC